MKYSAWMLLNYNGLGRFEAPERIVGTGKLA